MSRWLLLILLCAACGTPLVDDGYQGAPKLRLKGNPGGNLSSLESDREVLRVSLFWVRHLGPQPSFQEMDEQPSTGLPLELPWSFDWLIYDEPRPENFVTVSSGARWALAIPLVYGDRNHDGRFENGEPVLGWATTNAVVRAPVALSAEDSPTGHPLPAGFRLISMPLFCAPPRPPPPTSEGDCGVPLGQPCRTQSDCGANGVCLTDGPWPWPQGMCAVPEPPMNGCRPDGGALWRDHRPDDQRHDAWVKKCSVDADCGREFPYMCDLNHGGACLPVKHVLLKFEPLAGLPDICRGPKR